jgi:small subunit ribosomal protein S3
MGQKTHPYGFRLNVIRTWSSKWFEDKHYARWLHEDLKLRDEIREKFANAGIAGISIERAASKAKVVIATSRPGIIIGRRGAGVEQLKEELQKLTENELFIDIQEVRKAETNAQLVAENIATQLERRIAFRRAMKRAVQSAMRLGAEGIRINCAGRLGGAEIARMEWYREGRVPLHTLRADVDYGTAEAQTAYGTCGVKVWVFKGEILEHDPMASERRATEGDHSHAGERSERSRRRENA